VGRRVLVLVPERYRQAHVAGFTLRLLSDEGTMSGRPTVVPMLQGDGREVDRELLVQSERTGHGRMVFTARIGPPRS
jgi:hypothetical protein